MVMHFCHVSKICTTFMIGKKCFEIVLEVGSTIIRDENSAWVIQIWRGIWQKETYSASFPCKKLRKTSQLFLRNIGSNGNFERHPQKDVVLGLSCPQICSTQACQRFGYNIGGPPTHLPTNQFKTFHLNALQTLKGTGWYALAWRSECVNYWGQQNSFEHQYFPCPPFSRQVLVLDSLGHRGP